MNTKNNILNIPNKITELFKIKYPIIQGGMVWVSGWKLVSAVSNNGGLGLIGAGSMKPNLLCEHIQKCKAATKNPFGVNVPLLRQDTDALIKVIIDEKIKIVFTSAGNPAKYIDLLKKNNVIVVHVVSNLKQAIKAESVGCDAVVGEGVEAGGHNGADEISLADLITQLVKELKIPIIAAGGIADKSGIEKALLLGAFAVQIGTLFASSIESSAHINYKNAIITANENDSVLFFRKIGLTRGIINLFIQKAIVLENQNVSKEELIAFLGSKREKLGIFDGNLDDGILEAGTGISFISKIKSVKEIFSDLVE